MRQEYVILYCEDPNLNVLLFLSLTEVVQSFSQGTVVGITTVVTGTVALIVGFLAGVLVYHCISYHRPPTSKPETSSHQQQKEVSPCNPLQLTGPEYEEVVELRRNRSYEIFKVRENMSKHRSQSSEPESSSHQQQQTRAEYEEPVPAPSKEVVIDLRANVAYGGPM